LFLSEDEYQTSTRFGLQKQIVKSLVFVKTTNTNE
jgi:hypothetical protein